MSARRARASQTIRSQKALAQFGALPHVASIPSGNGTGPTFSLVCECFCAVCRSSTLHFVSYIAKSIESLFPESFALHHLRFQEFVSVMTMTGQQSSNSYLVCFDCRMTYSLSLFDNFDCTIKNRAKLRCQRWVYYLPASIMMLAEQNNLSLPFRIQSYLTPPRAYKSPSRPPADCLL
jgi:hypothetical protein